MLAGAGGWVVTDELCARSAGLEVFFTEVLRGFPAFFKRDLVAGLTAFFVEVERRAIEFDCVLTGVIFR